ncbi:hypothetical protein pdam_00009577 [Pocillopora damicornis]|uniref:Uncharacterized protein n=1 Tax=Pocillopora damicornis TaxID=46731 RepID=A0A3M6UQI5_POCDA|nr:hypothetical protein pdam_00009577 [Pocillopora damicornis]
MEEPKDEDGFYGCVATVTFDKVECYNYVLDDDVYTLKVVTSRSLSLREFQIPVTTSNIECFHSEQPCALQYLQDYPTALKSVKRPIFQQPLEYIHMTSKGCKVNAP